MRIGILQTGHAPDALKPEWGGYPEMFQRFLQGQGFDFETYSVVDMDFPESVHACDGWLLTGSRHGAYEDHPFIAPLEDFIRKAHAEAVPMVGICFGHQIIAQALGGKVEKFKGGWAVGPTEYEFDGQRLRLNAWHQDQVTVKPPGAKVIACNDFCENAALVYGDRALTVQAHPEFPNSFVGQLAEARGRGVVPDVLIDDAARRLDLPTHSDFIAARIAEFFRQPRGHQQV